MNLLHHLQLRLLAQLCNDVHASQAAVLSQARRAVEYGATSQQVAVQPSQLREGTIMRVKVYIPDHSAPYTDNVTAQDAAMMARAGGRHSGEARLLLAISATDSLEEEWAPDGWVHVGADD